MVSLPMLHEIHHITGRAGWAGAAVNPQREEQPPSEHEPQSYGKIGGDRGGFIIIPPEPKHIGKNVEMIMTTMNHHHPNSNEGFFESWILGGYRWIAQNAQMFADFACAITEEMHPTLQPDGMFSWAAPGELVDFMVRSPDLYPMTDPWCCYIWCSMDTINIPQMLAYREHYIYIPAPWILWLLNISISSSRIANRVSRLLTRLNQGWIVDGHRLYIDTHTVWPIMLQEQKVAFPKRKNVVQIRYQSVEQVSNKQGTSRQSPLQNTFHGWEHYGHRTFTDAGNR
jgi:hypothetical protein